MLLCCLLEQARDPDERATGGATAENAAEAVEPLGTSVTVPPDETAPAVGDESSRDADLLARCEELEREATAAAEKVLSVFTLQDLGDLFFYVLFGDAEKERDE